VAIETNEIAAALTYSTMGLGASLGTRRIIEAHGHPVAIIPVEGLPSFELALAWSRRRHRGPAAEAALAFARSALGQQVGHAGPGVVASASEASGDAIG
jgi:DNA-binding transcriptional LysR family regulator